MLFPDHSIYSYKYIICNCENLITKGLIMGDLLVNYIRIIWNFRRIFNIKEDIPVKHYIIK